MTLGELVSALRAASNDPVVARLTVLVEQWKSDPASVEDLRDTVERYIGNSWIASDKEHREVYRIWSIYRDENIGGLLAMTMNERLFAFDLFERYDAYFSDRGRLFQADRGRQNGAAAAALGKRAGTGLTVAQSSTISLKRSAAGRVSRVS